MDAPEILFTIYLNAIPILILIIPYFFFRKKAIRNLYLRIYVGILVFYFVYWVLPIIYQVKLDPEELEIQNNSTGILYFFSHLGSLVSLFAYYPLVTLPFIFFVAPFLSIFYVWNRLRKEEGSIKLNLTLLTYQLSDSPYKLIREELIKNNWAREKEILKLMIVLLPISLYLLQVILTVTGKESDPVLTGETALGWFIEILFVYLAIFILSIELIYISQITLKGRYIGEDMRRDIYKSLYSVGAPISILSILLFIVQYTDSIPIVLYFFAYFIMASIIFVLFLNIFEPIALLIFIKILDWWKHKKEKVRKTNFTNFYYGIVFSFLAVFVFLIINMLAFNPMYLVAFEDPDSIIDAGRFLPESVNPTLNYSILFDSMVIFNFFALELVPLIIMIIFLVYTLKYLKSLFLSFTSFLPIIILFSILFGFLQAPALINFAPEEYWITGQTSFFTIFGFNFYTFRTAALDANLSGLLGFLAVPYLFTRYIFNIIIWGLIIFYLKKNFRSTKFPIDESRIESTIFASVGDFITYKDYSEEQIQYLITKNPDIDLEDIEQEREEIKDLLNVLEKDTLLVQLKPQDENERKRLFFTLKYLFFNNFISIWKPEFSFTYERVEKQGLYIIYDDGRGIFNYPFVEETAQDPGLVSGMFSAITSFIKEMTKSTEVLKKIDHGDITILLEYGQRIFGALFIKGNESAEVRGRLRDFVKKFEEKYSDVLKDWSGALIYFKDDAKLVEEIFKEEE